VNNNTTTARTKPVHPFRALLNLFPRNMDLSLVLRLVNPASSFEALPLCDRKRVVAQLNSCGS
jgi:hypothetical protein